LPRNFGENKSLLSLNSCRDLQIYNCWTDGIEAHLSVGTVHYVRSPLTAATIFKNFAIERGMILIFGGSNV